MKAMIIHNQLEYRVETKADQFSQGDSVSCTFSIKNHGDTPVSLTALYLELASGQIKKIKEKAPDAFEVLVKGAIPSESQIAPRAQISFEAAFSLDLNCMVTDKHDSLFLIFGSREAGASGQGMLTVDPHRYVQAALKSLGNPHEFEVRGISSKAGWVEAKVKPPGVRRYMLVTELKLGARIEGAELRLRYTFKLKNLETTASTLGVTKSQKVVEQTLPFESFLFPNSELINSEIFDARVADALNEVANRL